MTARRFFPFTISSGAELIPVPSGFGWTPPFNIYKLGSTYYSDFDPTAYDFTSTADVVYYFNDITGNDANDGLSAGAPKKSIVTVITALNSSIPTNGAVFILQTDYANIYGASTIATNFSLVLKSDTPGVKRRFAKTVTDGSFLTATAPTYRYTRSGVRGPIDLTDLDSFGNPRRLTQVADGATCLATPGSFHQESANIIRFHLHDGRAPDSDVLYTRSGPCLYFTTTTARNFYFQDIEFLGSVSDSLGTIDFSVSGNPAHVVCLNNCDLAFSEYALKVWSGTSGSSNPMRVYLTGCNIYGGARDGGNYHNTLGGGDSDFAPNVFEDNCTFRLNGYTLPSGGSTPNNNGSSMHDRGKIIRLNCEYTYNQNRNIHDVEDNTQAWMLKCVAGYSQNTASDDDSIDFNCGDNGGSDAVEWWMDGCSFVGSSLKNLRVNTGSTVLYKRMDLTGWDNQINGTLGSY